MQDELLGRFKSILQGHLVICFLNLVDCEVDSEADSKAGFEEDFKSDSKAGAIAALEIAVEEELLLRA